MNPTVFFTVAAALATLYGLGFVFAPAMVIEQHGMEVTPGFLMLARVMGGALLGYAVLLWLTRKAEQPATTQAIARGFFVFNLVALIATFAAAAGGVMNAMGWVPVAIHLAFTAGFGYLAVVGPRLAAGPRAAA